MYKSAELRHDITVETSRILIDCLTVNLEIVSQYRNNNQHFAWSSCALHVFFFFGGGGGVCSFAAGCLLTFPSHSVSPYSKNSCSDNFWNLLLAQIFCWIHSILREAPSRLNN